jgi:GNAT superfamily N-acetyltransferase
MEKLRESIEKTVSPEALDALFVAIGWKKRGSEKWKEVLAKSAFVLSVWDGETLAGFGRIVEDGVMCMFYDIGVLPPYQSKGLGTSIMNKLVNEVKNKNYASIGLFTWEGNSKNTPFYEKFGFQKVGTGMELVKYMERE